MDNIERVKEKLLSDPETLAGELYTLERGILGRVKKVTSSYIIGDLCCSGHDCKYDIKIKSTNDLIVEWKKTKYRLIKVAVSPSIEWKEKEKWMISDPFTNHILISSLLNEIPNIQKLNGAGLCGEGKEGYLLQGSETEKLEDFLKKIEREDLQNLIGDLLNILGDVIKSEKTLYHPTISTLSCYILNKELVLSDFSLSSLSFDNGILLLPKGYEKRGHHEKFTEEDYFTISKVEEGAFFKGLIPMTITLYLFISSLLLNKNVLSLLMEDRYSLLSSVLLFSIWHPEEVSTLWKRVNEKKKPFDVIKGLRLRTNVMSEILSLFEEKES